jgi:predicted ATPase
MIESVEFHNFKVLRDTTLPLSRFTLIVGPNGSGKSTAMQALQAAGNPNGQDFNRIITAGVQSEAVDVWLTWGDPYAGLKSQISWSRNGSTNIGYAGSGRVLSGEDIYYLKKATAAIRIYSFDASAMTAPVPIQPNMVLDRNGANLAGVLALLQSREPERFVALNEELSRWLPEFDRVLLDISGPGQVSILLRMGNGHHKIQAIDISHGTLLSLAMLTLAYLPDPPPIVCIEEPDRGIHPRLLRDVQDALYRLSYPESGSEKREPIQVIATTHSPYLLDLFRDHPEEIVIANKIGQEARFERLSDQNNLDDILQDSRLGDAWYSGILGGVPAHP